ncbi:hypothetical protein CQW23_14402 [Capsicum baccatum]|uniref:Uncharacterized protein n=1 Tax=Capsicum baccatum TaxID=33114 RepID=A0A2G2WJ30_CAPBA|nr:hypothetical protein CQW23_14402 [Capsicum baccatum]
MKQPKELNVFSVADVYFDDEEESLEEEQIIDDPLAIVLMNGESKDAKNCEEASCALSGLGTYRHAPKKLDLDLKN